MYKYSQLAYCCGAHHYQDDKMDFHSGIVPSSAIKSRKNGIHNLYLKTSDFSDVTTYHIHSTKTMSHQVFLGESTSEGYVKDMEKLFNPDVLSTNQEEAWPTVSEWVPSSIKTGDPLYQVRYYSEFPESTYVHPCCNNRWFKGFDLMNKHRSGHKNGVLCQVFILNDEQTRYPLSYTLAKTNGFSHLPVAVRNYNTGNYLFYFYRLTGV